MKGKYIRNYTNPLNRTFKDLENPYGYGAKVLLKRKPEYINDIRVFYNVFKVK